DICWSWLPRASGRTTERPSTQGGASTPLFSYVSLTYIHDLSTFTSTRLDKLQSTRMTRHREDHHETHPAVATHRFCLSWLRFGQLRRRTATPSPRPSSLFARSS